MPVDYSLASSTSNSLQQTTIFRTIAESACVPTDRTCICRVRGSIVSRVSGECSSEQVTEANSFLDNFCPVIALGNNRPNESTPIVVIVTTAPPAPIRTSAPGTITVNPIGTNTTSTIALVTSSVEVVTTNEQGQSTTLTEETVFPVPPTPTVQPVGPEVPEEGPGEQQPGEQPAEQPGQIQSPGEQGPGQEFTGAGASIRALEMFGGVRGVLVAGGMGMMGLVFAEL